MSNLKDLVVITGGNGLIGSAIAKKLAPEFEVVILDKSGNIFPPVTSEIICMDLSNEKSVDMAFNRLKYSHGSKIASFIHLAAHYDFKGKKSPLYKEVTVKGTERILKKLQNFSVGQFLFSSSLLVYKPISLGEKITEKSVLGATWDYPKSKVEAEKMIRQNKGKIKSLTLRIAGIYSDKTQSIPISNQMKRIYEGDLTGRFYPGKLELGSSFLHLEDLTDAIFKAVKKREELEDQLILNLGEAKTLSYQQLQEKISTQIYGKSWRTYYIPPILAKAGAWIQNIFTDSFIQPWMINRVNDHYEIDPSLAKNLLDWNPRHALESDLPVLLNHLLEQPMEWYKENKFSPPSFFDHYKNRKESKAEKKPLELQKKTRIKKVEEEIEV